MGAENEEDMGEATRGLLRALRARLSQGDSSSSRHEPPPSYTRIVESTVDIHTERAVEETSNVEGITHDDENDENSGYLVPVSPPTPPTAVPAERPTGPHSAIGRVAADAVAGIKAAAGGIADVGRNFGETPVGEAVVGQLPAFAEAIAAALRGVGAPQRKRIVDELDGELDHLIAVCNEIKEDLKAVPVSPAGDPGDKGDGRPLVKPLRKSAYVAGKLIEYYDKHIKQLGPSARKLSVNVPVQTDVGDRQKMRDLTARDVCQHGNQLRDQAEVTVGQLEKIRRQLGHSTSPTDSSATATSDVRSPSVSRPMTEDALVYALEQLVERGQETSEVVQRVRSDLYNERTQLIRIDLFGWILGKAREQEKRNAR